MADPTAVQLAWAARALGPNATVQQVRGLHSGSSPWLLDIAHGALLHRVVLRVADMERVGARMIRTAAAAMQVAAEHNLPTSRLLAADLEGSVTGTASILESFVATGSTNIPPISSDARLHSAGAALAELHRIPLDPRPDLPQRVHPIPPDDYAFERRWAARYQSATEAHRSDVLDQLCAAVGWPQNSARDVLPRIGLTPLLLSADEQVRDLPRPSHPSVFVHGDAWAGNVIFDGDTCIGMIDWKSAGAGHPGVDLGSLRLNMTVQYGQPAADHVLDGWQEASGRPADHIAYWDAVAALNTPADMTGFWTPYDQDGRQLPGTQATARRDVFLRAALGNLETV